MKRKNPFEYDEDELEHLQPNKERIRRRGKKNPQRMIRKSKKQLSRIEDQARTRKKDRKSKRKREDVEIGND